MVSTTLGVKVDDALRDRLKAAAQKLNCTAHWLHKQALLSYIDRIERGQLPAEIMHLSADDATHEEGNLASKAVTPLFFEFCQDVQPQSVLRAAITAAYRRPEPECVLLLLGQAKAELGKDPCHGAQTGANAAIQAHRWRGGRFDPGVFAFKSGRRGADVPSRGFAPYSR